jgi:hypothetical protein
MKKATISDMALLNQPLSFIRKLITGFEKKITAKAPRLKWYTNTIRDEKHYAN